MRSIGFGNGRSVGVLFCCCIGQGVGSGQERDFVLSSSQLGFLFGLKRCHEVLGSGVHRVNISSLAVLWAILMRLGISRGVRVAS